LDNSLDLCEEIVEGFVPFLNLVRLDVGNEKAGGERAVYRDGSTFLCSSPSRGLWSTVVVVD
jgi:hypothetical protein